MSDRSEHRSAAEGAPGAGPAARWLSGHADEVASVVEQLVAHADLLDGWGARLGAVLAGGGRLLAAGNGGSAAEAQHLTAELVGRFVGERRALSAISLHAETSSLTAVANDYGAGEVFARGVEAHGRPGDVLVVLSASGRSENVLRAAQRAREVGLSVWAMTGPGPNPLSLAADQALCVDAPSTSAVQEGHLVALHALCAAVDVAVSAVDAAAATGGAGGGRAAAGSTASAGRRDGTTADGAAGDGAAGSGGGTGADASDGRAADDPAGSGRAGGARAGAGAAGPAGSSVRAAADDGAEPVGHPPAPRRVRLVVVGDVVLDRDLLGSSGRVAPDAPVPVVDLSSVRESPGGAGLTALLCAGPEVDVTLVAPVADDEGGAVVRAALERAGVALHPLGHAGATRTKTRVRVSGQSLVRLDDGGPGHPVEVDSAALVAVLADADVVLVSDYGAGTTVDPTVRAALETAAADVPVVWDPHPRGSDPVPGCALVTPNLSEARRVLGPEGPEGEVGADLAAIGLARRWRAGAVAVTAGAQGAYLAAAAGEPALYVPAPAVGAADPAGAGDCFAATAATVLARGAGAGEAVAAAVARASAWVDAGGASGWRERARAAQGSQRRAGRADTGADVGGGASGSGTDDGGWAAAEEVLARVRAGGGTVVATGGCFDVLHAGHVACLAGAARLGDALVVLLNSDASVARLKGEGRPVNTAADRAAVLLALGSVDAVAVFDQDDPREALEHLRPDVWAKGGDYAAADLPETPLVRGWGGRVVLLPHLAGRSTTQTLARGRRGAGDGSTGAVPDGGPDGAGGAQDVEDGMSDDVEVT